MKDTVNILSFDDARALRSRRSSAQSVLSSASSSRGARFEDRHAFGSARAESETRGKTRARAPRATGESAARSRGAFASERGRGFGAARRSGKARPPREDAQSDATEEASGREGAIASWARRKEERKRARVKERAGKAFDRQFRSSASDSPSAGPRAALYKGEMGSSHKRASRMQRSKEPSGGSRRFASAREGRLSALASSRKALTVLVAAACLAVTCFMLYEPAQNYYHAVREHDRLQAELAAVESRNAELEDSVAYLQTESGVEQSARDELGWVREGERSVYVQGLEGSDDGQSASSTAGSVVPGSIEAPATWYSPLLDAVFGVE